MPAPRILSGVLAVSNGTLGDILGFAVILGGLAICIALWWLMVWRPSREERRARAASEAARSHDPRADGPGSSV